MFLAVYDYKIDNNCGRNVYKVYPNYVFYLYFINYPIHLMIHQLNMIARTAKIFYHILCGTSWQTHMKYDLLIWLLPTLKYIDQEDSTQCAVCGVHYVII